MERWPVLQEGGWGLFVLARMAGVARSRLIMLWLEQAGTGWTYGLLRRYRLPPIEARGQAQLPMVDSKYHSSARSRHYSQDGWFDIECAAAHTQAFSPQVNGCISS